MVSSVVDILTVVLIWAPLAARGQTSPGTGADVDGGYGMAVNSSYDAVVPTSTVAQALPLDSGTLGDVGPPVAATGPSIALILGVVGGLCAPLLLLITWCIWRRRQMLGPRRREIGLVSPSMTMLNPVPRDRDDSDNDKLAELGRIRATDSGCSPSRPIPLNTLGGSTTGSSTAASTPSDRPATPEVPQVLVVPPAYSPTWRK